MQQYGESGLFKMMISRQRFGQASRTHDDERQAIRQTPFLVAVLGKHLQSIGVQRVAQSHNLNSRVSLNRAQHISRRRAMTQPAQRGTQFKQHGTGNQQGSFIFTHSLRDRKRLVMQLVAWRGQRDQKTCVYEILLTHLRL